MRWPIGSGNTAAATEPTEADNNIAVSLTDGGAGQRSSPREDAEQDASHQSVSHEDRSKPSSKKRRLDSNLEHVTDSATPIAINGGRFSGVKIEDILVLEVCAGSARLTKAARAKGFKGVARDHSRERSCGVDICEFELADPE